MKMKKREKRRPITILHHHHSRITSLSFCATSLLELTAEGYNCGVCGDEIATMGPQLWKVENGYNERITEQHLEGFTAVDGEDGSL